MPSSTATTPAVLGERESADGRSSTAPLEGGGRGAGRGGKSGGGGGGGGSVSGGLTHFDTEMEANRLAYVLHLQVCLFVFFFGLLFFFALLFVGCEKAYCFTGTVSRIERFFSDAIIGNVHESHRWRYTHLPHWEQSCDFGLALRSSFPPPPPLLRCFHGDERWQNQMLPTYVAG